jgi:predicted amidohydrolase
LKKLFSNNYNVMDHLINVALAQIAPVWLDKKATLDKILVTLVDAKKQDAELVVFGERLLPGHPFLACAYGRRCVEQNSGKRAAQALCVKQRLHRTR